jgi:pilus assembly protein CpaE
MSLSPAMPQDHPPVLACTISRDIQQFDMLIADMEAALGDAWGDLTFADAAVFLAQQAARSLQFVTLTIDAQDEARQDTLIALIHAAKAAQIKVLLVADDVSPAVLHLLLRQGADIFVPYPLPQGELARAIARLRMSADQVAPIAAQADTPMRAVSGNRAGVVVPVHGLAGGAGASLLAVNLAWELANITPKSPPRVCLLDLDVQFGAIATYLDLPRREAVVELLSDIAGMDADTFLQAMTLFGEKLQVLTAPTDLIPLDMMTPADITRLVETAQTQFDYVIIDMPSTLVEWTTAVLELAHVYFGVIDLDMRSAQNLLRVKRALQSEDLPFEKFRFVLNRAPGFTDLNGKARVKRMAESLGIALDVQLPDGGKTVTQSVDYGSPLAQSSPKSPLRKEIMKLAKSLHDVNASMIAEMGS